jgi:hypothetical protein
MQSKKELAITPPAKTTLKKTLDSPSIIKGTQQGILGSQESKKSPPKTVGIGAILGKK